MPDKFDEIFQSLREILTRAAPNMDIAENEPDRLVLRTPWIEARTGAPAFFGSVSIKKNYVAYHLMTIYVLPDLVGEIPATLQKRMQGKSCFNFRTADKALFADIEALTARAAALDQDLRKAMGK